MPNRNDANDSEQPRRRLRVREVPVTELRRRAAAVIDGVIAGEAAVISKHGMPIAVLVPFGDGETLLQREVAPSELKELDQMFERRARRRRSSELRHGRETWD